MKGVEITPLKRIPVPNGDVLHILRTFDPGFAGFGEAYVSLVHADRVKGWKRHQQMVLNLVVIHGAVRFLIRNETHPQESVAIELAADTPDKYRRLTVQPGLWVAFIGLSTPTSIVLNISSITHDPAEAEQRSIDAFPIACDSTL